MRTDWLTVQEAAHIAGVSASTLKRLCESESIPMIRTPGGHRRIDKVDLERFVATHRRSGYEKDEIQDGPENVDEDLLQCLLAGKSLSVAKALWSLSPSKEEIVIALEDHLVATLWKIGEWWRENRIDVYQEHLCSNTALTAIDILRQMSKTENSTGKVAVGGDVRFRNGNTTFQDGRLLPRDDWVSFFRFWRLHTSGILS